MKTPPKRGGLIPENSRNKGIMDKIRRLKIGEYIVAVESTRNRFYTDFAKLGWSCATRKIKGTKKIRVYRES